MPSATPGVVDVGVHVPDEIGRHGDEAAAGLAQPAGQQQQLAQRLGVIDVVVVVVPLLVDVLRPDQRRGVVAGDGPVVLLVQVESLGHAAQDHVECLLLDAVQAVEARRWHRPRGGCSRAGPGAAGDRRAGRGPVSAACSAAGCRPRRGRRERRRCRPGPWRRSCRS